MTAKIIFMIIVSLFNHNDKINNEIQDNKIEVVNYYFDKDNPDFQNYGIVKVGDKEYKLRILDKGGYVISDKKTNKILTMDLFNE